MDQAKVEFLKAAREEFESFAAMDAPEVPDNEVAATQVKLYRWQQRNFGTQPLERMALGIFEEVGELIEAFEAGNADETEDAIGDICVYATQACTSLRLSVRHVMDNALFEVSMMSDAIPPYEGLKRVGRLSHVILKSSQKIRGMSDHGVAQERIYDRLVDLMGWVCCHTTHSLDSILIKVAKNVMKRDWIASPDTGSASK